MNNQFSNTTNASLSELRMSGNTSKELKEEIDRRIGRKPVTSTEKQKCSDCGVEKNENEIFSYVEGCFIY